MTGLTSIISYNRNPYMYSNLITNSKIEEAATGRSTD